MTLNRRQTIQMLMGASILPLLSTEARAAGSPGRLVFGLSAFPASLDPFRNVGAAGAAVQLLRNRGLLGYAPDGSIRGELAESWESEAPDTWVFKLRDAKFQNGDTVTAEDVKWSIEYVAAEGSTAFLRSQVQAIGTIETPDAKTVRLITKAPNVVLPYWFASYYLPIMKAGSVGKEETGIGAGPFVITEVERGQHFELAPFADFYRDDMPKLDSIRVQIYADENLRMAALDAGDVDLIDYVPFQSMESIEANSMLRLGASSNGLFMCLLFNFNRAPFDDPRVRAAIGHAIKREDIVDAAFFGRGAPLGGFPISPGTTYFNAERANYWNYDPEKAKALLAEAGYADGFKATLLATSQYLMHESTALVVQQYLGDVGIEIELTLPDWATRGGLIQSGEYDFAVHGTAWDYEDPAAWVSLLEGAQVSQARGSYGMSIPRINELMALGAQTFEVEERKKIYGEVEEIALKEGVLVGLTWRAQGYGWSSALEGFEAMQGVLSHYSPTTLEKAVRS